MKNNKYWFFGSKLNTVLLLVLIILMVIAIKMMLQNKETYLPFLEKKVVTIDSTMPKIENKEQILGNKDDLISFSIWPNTKVSGVVSYRGVIKGGYFFEGNILVGIADLNKKIILQSNGIAKSDWMTIDPVSFEGNINFSKEPKGKAYLVIHNDNASGLPENDKSILIPIIIE